MREGHNPLSYFPDETHKIIPHKLPPDVPVVAVITHLPYDGSRYHNKRVEIVKSSVESAIKNVGVDCCFVVWDNGSRESVTEWLKMLLPDNLILSQNIGKQNAINALLSMYHGSIVAISDDDILHYPNWLQPQLDILQAFPDVGLVSGCVTRHYMKYLHLYAWGWSAEKRIEAKSDETPTEWDYQHGASIGKSKGFTDRMIQHVTPCKIKYNDTWARIGGNHCQFVGYTDTLLPFLPRTDKYMEPLYPFDQRVDKAKLLRLLTMERKTRHLGNVLVDEDREEIERVLT